jgi:hypothetical protein
MIKMTKMTLQNGRRRKGDRRETEGRQKGDRPGNLGKEKEKEIEELKEGRVQTKRD